jgi:hypothetical protein
VNNPHRNVSGSVRYLQIGLSNSPLETSVNSNHREGTKRSNSSAIGLVNEASSNQGMFESTYGISEAGF